MKSLEVPPGFDASVWFEGLKLRIQKNEAHLSNLNRRSNVFCWAMLFYLTALTGLGIGSLVLDKKKSEAAAPVFVAGMASLSLCLISMLCTIHTNSTISDRKLIIV